VTTLDNALMLNTLPCLSLNMIDICLRPSDPWAVCLNLSSETWLERWVSSL